MDDNFHDNNAAMPMDGQQHSPSLSSHDEDDDAVDVHLATEADLLYNDSIQLSDHIPIWMGTYLRLAKWKGLSPNIVTKQVKSSKAYTAKLTITIIGFIFGFVLCFIEIGGSMKINQCAVK